MTHPIVEIKLDNGKIISVFKDCSSSSNIYRCISCFGDGNSFTSCDFDCSCGYCDGIGEFSFDDATEV